MLASRLRIEEKDNLFGGKNMEKTYDDFDIMVGDIKNHIRANPGTKIIENDDILGLKIRYQDEKSGDSWQISVGDLHKWTQSPELKRSEGELIRRAFLSQEGKKVLLDIISKAR